MPVKVHILLLNNAMLSSVTGPLDAFSAAGTLWSQMMGAPPEPAFSVRLIGESALPLAYSGGLTLIPQHTLESADIADIVYVPSMILLPGQALPANMARIADWLRHQHQSGALLCSVCTGAYVLAYAGLLQGLQATTHWGFAHDFQRRFPAVKLQKNAVIVHNPVQRIITCGGGTSWHNLVSDLIREHSSIDIADQVKSLLLMNEHRHGQGAYARNLPMAAPEDRAVAAVQQWLKTHSDQANPVQQALAQTALAERTLKRRFKKHMGVSIIEYVQALRIGNAKELLVKSTTAIEEIARRVGYQDASFFRRIFRAETGLSPSHFRERFGRARSQRAD